MTPAGFALLVGPILGGLLLVVWWPTIKHQWRRRRWDRLNGWWHQQAPGHRWNPNAWATACEYSLAKSRERRSLKSTHP